MAGPLQTLRGGSLQVQHGLPARGRKSLCPPQPHPHHLPRAAHPRAQRRRRALAHLHASRRADPQPRRGRHPPPTRPAPHVRQGRHQANGVHHRRPHRQADHHGVRGGGGGGGVLRHCRDERGRRSAPWESETREVSQMTTCSPPNLTLGFPRSSSCCNMLLQCKLSKGTCPCISSGCVCMCPELLYGVLGLCFLWHCRCLYCSYLFSLTFLLRHIDSRAFLKHFSPILTNKTSAQ